MARILAISSQVARGSVGLSAAVPVLLALGHEVVALPTILLSNHPGHTRFTGERIPAELLGRMLDCIAGNGWLQGIDAVMTGYLPTPSHVDFASVAVDRVKVASPGAIHVCDPVLGDDPKGVYIANDAAEAIRDRLVPRADVLKMNRFECSWLAAQQVVDGPAAAACNRRLAWPATIVTSLPGASEMHLSNVLVESGEQTAGFSVYRRPHVPNGTGDLLAALWLGHRLHPGATNVSALQRAVAGVDLVVAASAGQDELPLAACLRELAA